VSQRGSLVQTSERELYMAMILVCDECFGRFYECPECESTTAACSDPECGDDAPPPRTFKGFPTQLRDALKRFCGESPGLEVFHARQLLNASIGPDREIPIDLCLEAMAEILRSEREARRLLNWHGIEALD
jgi:hypothetical protein